MKEKMLVLSILVLLEGIPYGFQLQALPLLLRQKGFDLWKITLLNALNIPWLLKSFIVPLLSDKHHTKIICGCVTLVGLCFTLIDMCIDRESMLLFSVVLAVCNISVVVLDVIVDRIAMSMAKEEVVSVLSTMRIVIYKCGMLSTCLGLVYTSSISNMMMVISLIYFISATTFYLLPTVTFTPENTPRDETAFHTRSIREKLVESFTCLKEVPDSYIMLIFCLFHKLGERGFLSILPIFLLDNGLNVRSISVINGVVGQLVSMFGSSIGGFYARQSSFHMLALALFLRLICMSFQLLYTVMVTDVNIIIYGASEVVLQITIGFITTLAFTKVMLHSMQAKGIHQVTNYSLLSSMIPFGKIFISTVSGSMADMMGSEMFLFSCCIMEVFLIFFVLVKRI